MDLENTQVLVASAHRGQWRKNNKLPYYIHLLRVKANVKEVYSHRNDVEKLMKIALLHDTMEDTWIDETFLKEKFDEDIASSVTSLTRQKGEKYDKYLKRVNDDEKAKLVKITDMYDNCQDLTEMSSDMRERRINKRDMLLNILQSDDKGFKTIKQNLLTLN